MSSACLRFALLALVIPAVACGRGAHKAGGESDDLLGLLVTPDGAILPVGQSLQLVATGLLDGRASVDLTDSVEWRVDDRSVVQVSDTLDEEGLAVGQASGVAHVFAVYEQTRSPDVTLTVTDAQVSRLSVAPTSVSLAEGRTVQMTATAVFTDGDQGDVSGQVRWITDDGTVAQFEGGGLLQAVGVGDTEVHAEWEALSTDDVPVTVTGASTTGKADLSISAASGSVEGGHLTLSVTVRNTGETGASGFWVDLFVDPSSTPSTGDTGDSYEWITYVGPDDTDTVDFEVPVTDGSHDVTVLVDTNDDIDEASESDNVFSTTVSGGSTTAGGPDLEVSYFDYYADSETVYYYVDVTNSGDEDADWFYVDLFLDESSEPALYSDGDDYTTIDGLAVGDTDYADFLLEAVCYTYCESWVMVDGYDYVDESDEDNNIDGPLYVYAR